MQIVLRNIFKSYHETQQVVLNDISLNINQGDSIAITGPSGSGKSTLLNMLGTLDIPSSGEVLIDGKSTRDFISNDLALLRNKKIGFVFQTHLLLPQLTVLENILLPVIPQDKTMKKLAPERARNLLNEVGLADRTGSYPGKMSVGECQRIAVVRALINEPELILADEPTGSLDHNSAERLSDLFMELRSKHSFTLVAVTHSQDLAKRMQVVYQLINGKLSVN